MKPEMKSVDRDSEIHDDGSSVKDQLLKKKTSEFSKVKKEVRLDLQEKNDPTNALREIIFIDDDPTAV